MPCFFQKGGLCSWSHIPSSRGEGLCTGRVSVRGMGSGSLSGGWGLCPGDGVSVQGGLCPVKEVFVQGGLCQGDPRTVKSGQYASYWNAFLF